MGIGKTVEAKTDGRDSNPRKLRQNDDMINRAMYLWDKVFQEVSCIMPYELFEIGVGVSDIRLLQYLYIHKQVPMSSIASWMKIGPPSATGMVDRLVERGLVVRKRDVEDWRRVFCRLTDMGQRLIGSQWGPSMEKARSRYEILTYRQLVNFSEALRVTMRAFNEIDKNS